MLQRVAFLNGAVGLRFELRQMRRGVLAVGCAALLAAGNIVVAAGTVFYVTTAGDDANPGTEEKPWKTVQKAADTMQPGDTVLIREGIYRENVQPSVGGSNEATRITYKAYPGEVPILSGSERISKWTAVEHDVWKAVVPDSIFGDYNPYTTRMDGEFLSFGQENHVGAVYLDGEVLTEAARYVDLPAEPKTWLAVHRGTNTTIYANFGGANPNERLAEILTRETVFFPKVDGLKYLTLDGITFKHAATGWVLYHGLQKAIVGTRAGYGWIIQNCHVSDGKTCGISSGQGSERRQGQAVGSHIFRNNVVERCGQAGFIGAGGYTASLIENNLIQDINYQRLIGGAESAGIKMHTSIDVTIRNNIIRRAYLGRAADSIKGIWLDWACQGFRISGNVIYDVEDDALNLEACHGPGLLDNNIVIGAPISSGCERLTVAHNLIVETIIGYHSHEKRSSQYFLPHTTQRAGSGVFKPTGDRYFNNLFIGQAPRKRFEAPVDPTDFKAGHNVYYLGAGKTPWDTNSLEELAYDPKFTRTDTPNGVSFSLKPSSAPIDVKCPLITRDFIGVYSEVNMGIEDHEGKPTAVDQDIQGSVRTGVNPAGPFGRLKPGIVNTFALTAGPAKMPLARPIPVASNREATRFGGHPLVTIARLAKFDSLDDAASVLMALPAREFRWKERAVGEARFALTADKLAILMQVRDSRMTPAATEWPETTVDVFGSALNSTVVRQVAFHLKGPDAKQGRLTLHQGGLELPAPQMPWRVRALPEGGYEVTSLIPLSLLQVPEQASAFLLECAVNALLEPQAAAQYLTLFHSVGAFRYNRHFALVIVE